MLLEWGSLMMVHELDAVLVTAGANPTYYHDDQHPPFHANAHFLRWVPVSDCEHAVLFIVPDRKPVLFWHSPSDYWYLPSAAPEFCSDKFEVRTFDDLNALRNAVKQTTRPFTGVRCIGQEQQLVDSPPSSAQHEVFLRRLDYRRAFKTDFERRCMEAASGLGVAGHRAAAQAFTAGESEYGIHLSYLRASEQHEAELPYPNIVAHNEHAATLHYQRYDRNAPSAVRSLLIDAGGKADCYHSDITRTYAADPSGEFAELINAVDDAQQTIIGEIVIGKPFLALHELMCQKVAEILCRFEFLFCSPTSAFDQRLTDAFFPHGLGHLLGLQTHDVGGHIVNEAGTASHPHERYESLRLLRDIEARMVFTVEPGIYFLPSLLGKLDGHQDVNWPKVERFLPYGGVRIEDNVYIGTDAVANLTRVAFNAVDAGAA